MPLLSDVEAFQASLEDISTVVLAELVQFWRALSDDDPVAMAVALREFMPDLVDTYQPVSAEIAAQFYDESRARAGVAGQYDAKLADRPNSDKIQVNLGWALEPLFRKTQVVTPVGVMEAPASDPDLALSRTSNVAQLVVGDGARDTIDENITSDPVKPRYARHASANACAFCALMASRGAVYRSETSAAGKKYHAHCHCVAYAVFPGEKDESASYVTGWDKAYVEARRAAIRNGQKPDLKNVLHHMRPLIGAA